MIEEFDPKILKNLYIPPADSHKGQNGKLLIIAGSRLFHSSSLWALKVASRIVDMVFYSSVPENNQIVMDAKKEFRDGIVVPREKIEDYVKEADSILIGPGLPRKEGEEKGDDDTKKLTENLLKKYPEKKWVIDGGSLQTIDPFLIPFNAILTPHLKEFEKLFNFKFPISNFQSISNDQISKMARKYNCVIVLKGPTDIVCPPASEFAPPAKTGTVGQGRRRSRAGGPKECVNIVGGNAGMTKGGTGDVLAGLIAALYCKNDAFLSATAGSYINKKAGESLFERVGYYFNSSDLVDEIPRVMSELILK